MADAQNTHKLFSYSKRNEETENKSEYNYKNKIKAKYILHPYKEEETGDKLIILEPKCNNKGNTNNHKNTRSQRARSAGTHSKSKIKMKKPKKHRFYLKNKNKLLLKPSDSDRTNTTTNYKKSYHANQRKKRLFNIDNNEKIIGIIANNDSINSMHSNNSSNISDDTGCISPQPLTIQSSVTDDNIKPNTTYNDRPSLSLRSTQSNPSKPSYSSSELISLGIGGDIFTDYNINDINIENNQLIYKENIILSPNYKQLYKWTCLEVCAWILSINNGIYNNNSLIQSFICNNINGKALIQLKLFNIMKLTKYEINVNECTNLLNEINDLQNMKTDYVKMDNNNNNNNNINNKTLKLGIESSDDIDIPLFSNDIDSNQIIIEQGRFWRLFYFPNDKLLQYDVDKPVNKWTPYEVSLWINNIFDGKFSKYSHYFIQYQIDGESLLNITRKSATNHLKMISPNIRRLFFDELRALSTLKQCNIRQNNQQYHTIIDKQIKRITHRFTQNDITIFTDFTPQTSDNSIQSNDNDNDNNNDAIVAKKAQKIIKSIHKKNATNSHVITADLTPRGQTKNNNNNNNNTLIHNFISGEEDDDNITLTMHCQHLTKNEMDFYNDTNLHFIAGCDDENKQNKNDTNIHILMDPNNKPAPSVGALFNATDINILSDDINIEQINKTLDNNIPLSIGMVANIDTINKSISITSDPSTEKLTDKITNSRQSSYNTDTLSSPKQNNINVGNKKLSINLTTPENATSFLVEGSYSNDSNQLFIGNTNIRRVSDFKNIHHSFEEYTNINTGFDICEQDDLELDMWDDKLNNNNNIQQQQQQQQQQHVVIDSFLDDIDDADPINESLSPVSISIYKYNKKHSINSINNKSKTMNASISFPFDDIEEKMNELDKESIQLCHEANLTLELNQPISDETDDNNYNINNRNSINDIYN